MDRLAQALHGAAAPVRPPPRRKLRRGLVVGAGGALGSALLEQALGCGGFDRVAALAVRPIDTALRGFASLPIDAGLQQPLPPGSADSAWIVFDRERRANGRDDAFWRPSPATLAPLARWLCAGGVRRLVIVLPHAPGLLPQALRHGLASLDEQAVAALGFEQLVLLRSAQPAPSDGSGAWLPRLAQLLLSQLHWMVPQHEQPVRPARVAAFAVQLALALGDERLPPGTRVAPPELVWQAARSDDLAALTRQWLTGAPR